MTRRFQFSLRTMLASMLVVAAFVSGIRFERDRKRRADEAAPPAIVTLKNPMMGGGMMGGGTWDRMMGDGMMGGDDSTVTGPITADEFADQLDVRRRQRAFQEAARPTTKAMPMLKTWHHD